MRNKKNETDYAGTTPYYILNSQGKGNFGTSVGGTGKIASIGYYSVNNIYDLAGNVYDWTLEVYNLSSLVCRLYSIEKILQFNDKY